jgi:hypothetical protein
MLTEPKTSKLGKKIKVLIIQKFITASGLFWGVEAKEGRWVWVRLVYQFHVPLLRICQNKWEFF